jgi:hypothetical protein
VRLSLGNLTDVFDREDDPAAALMEGNLPTVRASPQCALRQIFEPQGAEDLRRLSRREDGSKPEGAYVGSSHINIITVMQIIHMIPLLGIAMVRLAR